MRLVAQEWHHATRERRGVRANAPRLNYVSLFYVDIEFDGSSLHREPSLVWIWGVHADGSSMARIRFDDTGPVVVDEIDPDTRMSISLDEARVSFRRAIETASGRLPGDPAVVRFRLGWTGTGAYRIQETIYPSNDDVIAWTVETADGRAIQFDANTFQPVSR